MEEISFKEEEEEVEKGSKYAHIQNWHESIKRIYGNKLEEHVTWGVTERWKIKCECMRVYRFIRHIDLNNDDDDEDENDDDDGIVLYETIPKGD